MIVQIQWSNNLKFPRQFPGVEGHRSKYLVSCRNKRQRYITKFNKAINIVTEPFIQITDINEINRSNDLFEVVVNKISKLISEILKHELSNKIKEQDFSICITLEFKLIQLQNSIKPYIDMIIKPRKSRSLRSPLHHSIAKKCKSALHADSQKGFNSSSSSKKNSKVSQKSSLTKSSKESLNLSDYTPPFNKSYLSFKRRETFKFDQLLAEQRKKKLLILEKGYSF